MTRTIASTKETTKVVERVEVTVVEIIPDENDWVPYLFNQSLLSEYVYFDRPCEVWCRGFCFYSSEYHDC